jgi:hypothetical protein
MTTRTEKVRKVRALARSAALALEKAQALEARTAKGLAQAVAQALEARGLVVRVRRRNGEVPRSKVDVNVQYSVSRSRHHWHQCEILVTEYATG